MTNEAPSKGAAHDQQVTLRGGITKTNGAPSETSLGQTMSSLMRHRKDIQSALRQGINIKTRHPQRRHCKDIQSALRQGIAT